MGISFLIFLFQALALQGKYQPESGNDRDGASEDRQLRGTPRRPQRRTSAFVNTYISQGVGTACEYFDAADSQYTDDEQAADLEACKTLCDEASCFGIEWTPSGTSCKIHNRPIGDASSSVGSECFKAIGGWDGDAKTMRFEYLDHPDAVCNDGTRAGFYYKAAPPGFDHIWVILQQGGGWCYNDASCSIRQDHLVSSNSYTFTYSIPSFSLLAAAGTDYENGHKVYVRYCTSDAYIGNVGASASTNNLNFRGRVVVEQLMNTLQARGMGEGSMVVYGGCSAGGRGVMHNLNYVGRKIANGSAGSVQRLVGLIDSGFYLGPEGDFEDYSKDSEAKQVVTYTGADIDPTCVAAYPSETWKCLMGEYAVETLQFPHVVSASLADTYQLSSSYSDAVKLEFRTRTRDGLVNALNRGNAAVHGPSCADHCSTMTSVFSTGQTIQGVSLANLVDTFLFQGDGPKAAIDTCDGYACSTTCRQKTRPIEVCGSGSCTPLSECDGCGNNCSVWKPGNSDTQCYKVIPYYSPYDFVPVGSDGDDGACRGTSATNDPQSWYYLAPSFSGSEEDCQEVCSDLDSCKAYEYNNNYNQHCEIWTELAQAIKTNAAISATANYTCKMKVNRSTTTTSSPTSTSTTTPGTTTTSSPTSTSTTTPGTTTSTSRRRYYVLVDENNDGACRGTTPTKTPSGWVTVLDDFSGSLEDCQTICTYNSSCRAVEFNVGNTYHCELWWYVPQYTGTSGWTCTKKVTPSYNYSTVGNGPCRGTSTSHDPPSWRYSVTNFGPGSLENCEALCSADPSCLAVESQGQYHCEIWTQLPQVTSSNSEYTCRKKNFFTVVGNDGACRGTSLTDDPDSWKYLVQGFDGTLEDCQTLCLEDELCLAIEYKLTWTKHCEIWTQLPEIGNGNSDWTCLAKVWAPATTTTTIVIIGTTSITTTFASTAPTTIITTGSTSITTTTIATSSSMVGTTSSATALASVSSSIEPQPEPGVSEASYATVGSDGACRGRSLTDDPDSWKYLVQGFDGTLEDCQTLCLEDELCLAIEYKLTWTKHCEIWTQLPEIGNGNSEYTCLAKVLAPTTTATITPTTTLESDEDRSSTISANPTAMSSSSSIVSAITTTSIASLPQSSTTPSTGLRYEIIGVGGACRGNDINHNPSEWFTITRNLCTEDPSCLEDCKNLCTEDPSCLALEYSDNEGGYCELWTQLPTLSTDTSWYTCLRKVLPDTIATTTMSLQHRSSIVSTTTSWQHGQHSSSIVYASISTTSLAPASSGPSYVIVGDDGACRGVNVNHDPSSWRYLLVGFEGSVEDCQAHCTANVSCLAIEYHVPWTKHCEIWIQLPTVANENSEYTCRMKVTTTTTTADPFQYELVAGTEGACRGTTPSSSPGSWFSLLENFNGSMADCQRICSDTEDCKAFEYNSATKLHCEIWTEVPLVTFSIGMYTCRKKVTPSYNYTVVGNDGACRGTSVNDNPLAALSLVSNFNGSLQNCQALCTANASCLAVEYWKTKTNHCEFWMTAPQVANGNSDFTCLIKDLGTTPDTTMSFLATSNSMALATTSSTRTPISADTSTARVATTSWHQTSSATTFIGAYWVVGEDGACRGESRNHNPDSWHYNVPSFDGRVEDCKAFCSADPSCEAFEYDLTRVDHCELWTQLPQFANGADRYTCQMKERPTSPTTTGTGTSTSLQATSTTGVAGIATTSMSIALDSSAISSTSSTSLSSELSGSMHFSATGIFQKVQVEQAATAVLARRFQVAEEAITAFARQSRRLKAESGFRKLSGEWIVDFIVSVPDEQRQAVLAKVDEIKADLLGFSSDMSAKLVEFGVPPSEAAIAVHHFMTAGTGNPLETNSGTRDSAGSESSSSSSLPLIPIGAGVIVCIGCIVSVLCWRVYRKRGEQSNARPKLSQAPSSVSLTGSPIPALPVDKRFHYFLSHKKTHSVHGKSSEYLSLYIHDALQSLGWSGFFDVDNLKKISQDELKANVEASCVIIVAVNDETCDSEWCRLEWVAAQENAIPVVCVIDLRTFHKADVLAKVEATNPYLLQHQWVDYTDRNRKQCVNDCADWLHEIMDEQKSQAASIHTGCHGYKRKVSGQTNSLSAAPSGGSASHYLASLMRSTSRLSSLYDKNTTDGSVGGKTVGERSAPPSPGFANNNELSSSFSPLRNIKEGEQFMMAKLTEEQIALRDSAKNNELEEFRIETELTELSDCLNAERERPQLLSLDDSPREKTPRRKISL